MRRVARRRLGAIAATLSWAAAIAIMPGNMAAAAGMSPHMATAAKRPVSYYNLHPCALITQSQAGAALGVPVGVGLPLPNSNGGQCSYRRSSKLAKDANKNLDYLFQSGAAPSPGSIVVGKVVREPSVGRNAICTTTGATATLYANVPGKMKGKPAHLVLSTDTCGHAVTLVKGALARIS